MATIGLILPQQTYEFVFTEAGEYPYHCEPHPWMTGKVTVERGRF
jgi:plastocyanin